MSPKLLAETAGMIGLKELKDAFREVSPAHPFSHVASGTSQWILWVIASWRRYPKRACLGKALTPFPPCPFHAACSLTSTVTAPSRQRSWDTPWSSCWGKKRAKTKLRPWSERQTTTETERWTLKVRCKRCANAPLRPRKFCFQPQPWLCSCLNVSVITSDQVQRRHDTCIIHLEHLHGGK